MDDDTLRQCARRQWACDTLEIDPDAAISNAETGAWIAAWVWVDLDDNRQPDSTGA